MSTKTLLLYWRNANFVPLILMLIAVFAKVMPAYILLSIFLLVTTAIKVFIYREFRRKMSDKEISVFGVGRELIIKKIIGTVIYVLLFAAVIVSIITMEMPDEEDPMNWVWIAFFASMLIEQFFRMAHWTLIVENGKIHGRSIFFSSFYLSKDMSIRKITKNKIELEIGDWSKELSIHKSEIEELQRLIDQSKDN